MIHVRVTAWEMSPWWNHGAATFLNDEPKGFHAFYCEFNADMMVQSIMLNGCLEQAV